MGNWETTIQSQIKTVTISAMTEQKVERHLVLVRHGDKMITGEADPGLSFFGQQQAVALDWKTDCVFVSPLKRTLQTYTASFIKARDVCVRSCFRERIDGISTYFPLESRSALPEPEDTFKKRVSAAAQLLRQHAGEHITVISHEDFLFALQIELGVHEPQKLGTGEVMTLKIS
jgi:broad specificity phosphatase PhoE